jgi:1,4-dihydroxy-2-naphthoyl-CoA hydrolase
MSSPCDSHAALERSHPSKRPRRLPVGRFTCPQQSVRVDLIPAFEKAMEGRLPGQFGIRLLAVERGRVEAELDLRPEFLAPNDYLHAGTVVTLADSCCGMGCIASLPEGAAGFTTVELKTNFLRSAQAGDRLTCEARLAHGGGRTQVWDALVRRGSDGKDLALFRCTQYLLPAGDPRTAEQAKRSRELR